jgi:hypothetical protein
MRTLLFLPALMLPVRAGVEVKLLVKFFRGSGTITRV